MWKSLIVLEFTALPAQYLRYAYRLNFFFPTAGNTTPSLYIQMDFKFTWTEFCLMETYFKTKLAELLLQDNGEPINATQIYLINFDVKCPAKNNVDKASLLFYVAKADGTVDKDMTKQAFNILYYLTENNLGQLFGPVFELKVTWLNFLTITVHLLMSNCGCEKKHYYGYGRRRHGRHTKS